MVPVNIATGTTYQPIYYKNPPPLFSRGEGLLIVLVKTQEKSIFSQSNLRRENNKGGFLYRVYNATGRLSSKLTLGSREKSVGIFYHQY